MKEAGADASRMLKALTRQNLVDALMGEEKKATLVLANGWVVNVLTREIYAADVAVYGEHILLVGDASGLIGPNTRVVDLERRRYVAPGFIDSHMHFESSMLSITEFSRLSIPSGTTTLVADPHEIGNALGPAGILAMAEEASQVPNRVYLVVPALTPDCPDLETAGYDITSRDVPAMLDYPRVIGIGELQGFSNARFVYQHTPDIVTDLIASTTYARENGKTVDGNIPELFGRELAAHIIAGGTDVSCHETTRKDECLEKLRYGVYVFMREGSTQKNMAECIRAVREDGVDSRRLIGATDDMVGADLLRLGHMNWVASRIVAQGIDPVEAIQMVTINPAEYFGLSHVGVLAPGKMADMVVLSDLAAMEVEQVYIGGKLAAEKGKLQLSMPSYQYPAELKQSVRRRPVTAEELAIAAKGNRVKGRTIRVIPDQNLTQTGEYELSVKDGKVRGDLAADVLPIAVVERYGRTGGIGRAFVKGFGMKRGAMAESVSHDAHNIIVTGTCYEDMAVAVNQVIAMQGGVALALAGKVIGALALPVGGLMTDELDGFALSEQLDELQRIAAESLGCTIHSPFMHLSFLSLTTSPEWKITDKGLIDVNHFRVISPLGE